MSPGSPEAEYAVDVTDHFASGVASLRAHSTYLAGLGDGPMGDPAAFLARLARAAGERLGCQFAVPIELLSVG